MSKALYMLKLKPEVQQYTILTFKNRFGYNVEFEWKLQMILFQT